MTYSSPFSQMLVKVVLTKGENQLVQLFLFLFLAVVEGAVDGKHNGHGDDGVAGHEHLISRQQTN